MWGGLLLSLMLPPCSRLWDLLSWLPLSHVVVTAAEKSGRMFFSFSRCMGWLVGLSSATNPPATCAALHVAVVATAAIPLRCAAAAGSLCFDVFLSQPHVEGVKA